MVTPGSGGYGPPSERDAKAIAEDLADGYVTEAGLDRDYRSLPPG
jgi:N-methylhydantoinase B/oxoprolinase/acetone carboxylase alpha subunit